MTGTDTGHVQLDKAELETAIAATPGEKVTDADLDRAIIATQFEYPVGTTLTLCILTLRNGFNVVGESACVDPQNYNKDIGDTIAYNNARNKIWLLEGYALAERRRVSHQLAREFGPFPGGTVLYVGTKCVAASPEERDGKPGYNVMYKDGYTSWSPAGPFEEAYTAVFPGFRHPD
jgi:hypothetical protein